MNKVILLDRLKEITLDSVKNLVFPVKLQKGDTEQQYRTADVYLMRLPDSSAAIKKAPYIIHQILTGKDIQKGLTETESTAAVRSLFCVYSPDEQEGGLMLLNLMERLRITLLKSVTIGSMFTLDRDAGIEMVIYPDDTAPYYAGEMSTIWRLPAIEREVDL